LAKDENDVTCYLQEHQMNDIPRFQFAIIIDKSLILTIKTWITF